MKALISAALFFSAHAHAVSFESKVHSIDYSTKTGEPHLVLLENGRVLFVKDNQKTLLKSFQKNLRNHDHLEIEVDEENNLLNVEKVEPINEVPFPSEYSNRESYVPTIVPGGAAATSIFRRMRRDYQNESQCYNRAHIWAWEEFQNSGLKSKKHFLFFTRRYIRNYNYKWWFHVSPSVIVKGYSGDRILDRRYTGGHRSISSWVRNFVYSGRACPVVNKYYDYRNNQETEDCYLIPVSMYFWQPRDIERRDRTGAEKTQFFQREVDYAYWEAF